MKDLTNFNEFAEWIGQQEESYKYMLLNRMQTDCDYYLNYETHCPKEYNHLWAHHEPEAQIKYMRHIWDSLTEKPTWLTAEQLDEYERRMVA